MPANGIGTVAHKIANFLPGEFPGNGRCEVAGVKRDLKILLARHVTGRVQQADAGPGTIRIVIVGKRNLHMYARIIQINFHGHAGDRTGEIEAFKRERPSLSCWRVDSRKFSDVLCPGVEGSREN